MSSVNQEFPPRCKAIESESLTGNEKSFRYLVEVTSVELEHRISRLEHLFAERERLRAAKYCDASHQEQNQFAEESCGSCQNQFAEESCGSCQNQFAEESCGSCQNQFAEESCSSC